MTRLTALLDRWVETRPRLLLTLAALLTRVPFAGLAPMSVDETRSVQMAERLQGSVDVAAQLAFDTQAPLYPLLTAAQLAGGVADGRWLRLLPLVASVATVPLLYSLFKQWVKPREAFVGVLAAVFSSFLIFYAKEARPYAIAALFFTAFLLLAERWQRRTGGRRAWILLPVVGAASVSAHFLALPSLLAYFVVKGAGAIRDRSAREIFRLGALGLLLCVAMFPLIGMLLHYAGSGGYDFVAWDTAEITLAALFAEQIYFVFGNSLPTAELRVFHLCGLVLALPPVISEIRARRSAGEPLPGIVTALWWLPLVLLLLAGWLTGSRLLYFPRAFLPAAPLLLLLWSLGSLRWWRAGSWRRVVAATGVICFGALGLVVAGSSRLHPEYFGRSLIADFRQGVASRLESTDLVLVHHEILTSYIGYEWPGPQEVAGLGAVPMTVPAEERARAIRRQLAGLPADRRVVVILNAFADEAQGVDVAAELGARREREGAPPCWPEAEDTGGLLCREIWIYGRVEAGRSGPGPGGAALARGDELSNSPQPGSQKGLDSALCGRASRLQGRGLAPRLQSRGRWIQ